MAGLHANSCVPCVCNMLQQLQAISSGRGQAKSTQISELGCHKNANCLSDCLQEGEISICLHVNQSGAERATLLYALQRRRLGLCL